MFVTNGPNTIVHEDADCHCSCCKQLHKPDKIVALPSLLFPRSANVVTKTAHVETNAIAAAHYRDNVISISAAMKSAKQVSTEKVRKAMFKYPMLECS